MKTTAELLAMLAEHGVMIGHVPGGIPRLVGLDIAGALGMMHDEPGAAMLLAKYSMDAIAAGRFVEYWRRVIDRKAYVERWTHERQVLLAEYSFAEWMDAQRCRTCKGVATQMTPAGLVEPCPACDGIGLRKIGDRPVARALKMSNEGYRKSAWPARMRWARADLVLRENRALAALAARIGRS